MKKILLLTVLLACVCSFTQAQNQQRRTPEERLLLRVKELKDSLSLTDAQAAKVKAICAVTAEKQTEVYAKMREAGGQQMDSDARAAMQKQLEPIQTKENNDIKALLTATQKTTFEKYLKNREARMRNFQRGQGGGGNR